MPPSCTIIQASYQDTLAQCAGKADLIFTSPPYADARTYGADVSWTGDEYQQLGWSVFNALRPGGTAIINISAPVRVWEGREGLGTERGLHAYRFLLFLADEVGFRVPDVLAYSKLGAPGAYMGRFRADWEPILWVEKPGLKSYFDKNSIASSAVSGSNYRESSPVNLRHQDGCLRDRQASGWAYENGMKQRGTVWDYGTVGPRDPLLRSTGHPARFVLNFARDAILCFCPPNGLVVDPFVGSGTTAVAAISTGRSFFGGDLFCRPEDGKPWADVSKGMVSTYFTPDGERLFFPLEDNKGAEEGVLDLFGESD